MKIVTESQAWDMITRSLIDTSRETLVNIIIGYLREYGDSTTGKFTVSGLANVLESLFDDKFKVVADSSAAHILYNDKKS
jgi:hypothetical protein